jgi:chromosome segregation ATPase
MGVLTLDTSAVNRVKTEAAVAANDAKVAADNAKNAIATAIASTQQEMPRLVIEKLNVGDVQQKVVEILTERMNRNISNLDTKIAKVAEDLNAEGKRITSVAQQVGAKVAEDLNAEVKRITGLAQQVGDLQKTAKDLNAQYSETQTLISRWQTAVEVVNKTTADQTLARTVWLVLRNDAWFLLGSLVLSIAAFILALWAFVRSRRKIRNVPA